MKSSKEKAVTLTLMILGSILVFAAVLIFIIDKQAQSEYKYLAEKTAEELSSLLPPAADAVIDDRVDTGMARTELDGVDFIGILDAPLFDSKLPVASDWDKKSVGKYPCRYGGSVYDSSLIIGGSDNAGQLDFIKLIGVGDSIYFTDTQGNRYSYKVSEIIITKSADKEKLESEKADLVIYAKNTYTLDYTVVRCVFAKK